MEIVRWEPFEGFNGLHNCMKELFEEAFNRSRPYQASGASAWWPPVDILESKDGYLLRAELPDMKREDFNLEVKDGMLTLSRERKFDEAANGVQYHRVERAAGKFTRTFSLPQSVNSNEIKASYRDGVLEIHVPKAEEAKPKQISISVN
jgi:HSP20 family protein